MTIMQAKRPQANPSTREWQKFSRLSRQLAGMVRDNPVFAALLERMTTTPAAVSEDDARSRHDDILTVEQAADLLHLTPPTVRQMASRNQLRGRRLGKLWRFSRAKLIEFIEAGEPQPMPNACGTRNITSGVDSLSAIEAFNNLREQPRGRR
jgi:excisionase family DNA binding protein